MGVSYRQLVFPEAEHFRFRPTPEQLMALVDELWSMGWLRREADCRPIHLTGSYKHPSAIRESVLDRPRDRLLYLYLAGGSDPCPDDWTADFPVYLPVFCEDVTVIESPRLLVFPGDMNGGRMPCRGCPADLFSEVVEALEEAWTVDTVDDAVVLAKHGYSLAPEVCKKCGAPLQPEQMTLTHSSGKPDPTPFFHFGLAFEALRAPDKGTAGMDPSLLEACRRSCSVPFRATERWE